jgi:hypothetical protein
MALILTDVMNAIYDCEENSSLSISSDWDGGWRVTIGGSAHTAFEAETYVADLVDAAKWLHEQATQRYPAYKERYGDRVIVARHGNRSLRPI